jgi:hypothetical protein
MVSLNSFPYLGLGLRPVSRVPSPAGYWPALGADSRIQTANWPDAINGQVIHASSRRHPNRDNRDASRAL